jgi:hypothetical protein
MSRLARVLIQVSSDGRNSCASISSACSDLPCHGAVEAFGDPSMARSASLTSHHVTVGVNHDHLRGLTRCHPSVGIAELVWNALDADAKRVRVWLRDAPLGGVGSVEVDDDGCGIDVTRVDAAFGSLGGSWKANKKVSDGGRVLHGRSGKGRFRAGGIGRLTRWQTVNRAVDGMIHSFGVTIDSSNLKDAAIDAIASELSKAATGTRVVVSEIHTPHSKAFDEDLLRERLTEEFGPYLLQYPAVVIELQGERLDPKRLIGHQEKLSLETASGTIEVKLVEWKKSSERRIFLCEPDGTTLTEVPMRSHLLDGYVTAYASAEQFRALNVQDLAEGQVEQLEEIRPVLTAVRDAVKGYVRKRLAARSQSSVERWKEEEIYPYRGEPNDEIEAVERQVFDIVAVQVDRFLPKFSSSAKPVKRMQFSLLRWALESQPDELAEIINALVGLPASERKLLHDLLQRTSFSNIIRATRIVDERLHFLRGLEEMLADPDLRAGFLERDHLHELLAKNTWIFGDAYALTVSDESLTEAVRRHVSSAGLEVAVDEAVLQSDERQGRVDLMLTRALGSPAHSREHLIIELKRPTVKGGEEIVAQVKRYARALASDPRWRDTNTRWTFWAVTYDLDAFGQAEINQGDRPRNLIDKGTHHTAWLRTWGSLLEDCRGRLQYLRDALELETKKEAGIRHLKANYTSSMPEIIEKKVGGRVKQVSVKRTRPASKSRGKSGKAAPRGRVGRL